MKGRRETGNGYDDRKKCFNIEQKPQKKNNNVKRELSFGFLNLWVRSGGGCCCYVVVVVVVVIPTFSIVLRISKYKLVFMTKCTHGAVISRTINPPYDT